MKPDAMISATIPYSDFGEPSCCGCLVSEVHGNVALISCNECGAVVRSVSTTELQHALDEMESTLDLAIVICRHCGAVIHQPVQLIAFVL
jgi:hypothetical protein